MHFLMTLIMHQYYEQMIMPNNKILFTTYLYTFLSGLFGVYFVSNGTTPIDTFIQHLQEKWMSMCNSLSDFEVERAKNSLRTNMLLQLDGTTAICEDIGNILF